MTDVAVYDDWIDPRWYRLMADEPERFPDWEDPSEANDDEFDDDSDDEDQDEGDEDEINEDFDDE